MGPTQGKYDFENEYSLNLETIYSQYLSKERENCYRGKGHSITKQEFLRACHKADQVIEEFRANDTKYLATDPRGLNFNRYLYEANIEAIHNEIVTKELAIA